MENKRETVIHLATDYYTMRESYNIIALSDEEIKVIRSAISTYAHIKRSAIEENKALCNDEQKKQIETLQRIADELYGLPF